MIDPTQAEHRDLPMTDELRILPTRDELRQLWRVGVDAFMEAISTFGFRRNREFAALALFGAAIFAVLPQLPSLEEWNGGTTATFSANSHITRADNWLAKGDINRAIAEYDRAIKFAPKNALAYSKLAAAWSLKSDFLYNTGDRSSSELARDAALENYGRAIELDPKSADLYVTRGNIWSRAGRLDLAIDDYTRAIELDPKSFYAWTGRGDTWSAKRDYARAIDDYNHALSLNRNSATALASRGRAKLKSGDTAGGNADIAAAERSTTFGAGD
jgi:tetratricopeptide (TPR) repeat protein